MHRRLAWLPTLIVGSLAGAVSYVLGSTDPLLTASIVGSYGVCTRLAILHPDVVYEQESAVWAVGRWSGAATGFVLAVAFFGVGPRLPLEAGLRLILSAITS